MSFSALYGLTSPAGVDRGVEPQHDPEDQDSGTENELLFPPPTRAWKADDHHEDQQFQGNLSSKTSSRNSSVGNAQSIPSGKVVSSKCRFTIRDRSPIYSTSTNTKLPAPALRENSPIFEPEVTPSASVSNTTVTCSPLPIPNHPTFNSQRHDHRIYPSAPNMDPALARAKSMKGNLVSSSITVPCASGTDPTSPTTLSPIPLTSPASSKRRRLPVETDPENILIKTLRTEHSMDWTSIANYLNRERQKRGEPQTMTQPAVYSRFVRNAPKIAQVNGEVGFDVKDFMYLRHPHYYIDQVNVQLGVANTGNRELSASGAPLNYGGAPMGGFRKRKAPAPAVPSLFAPDSSAEKNNNGAGAGAGAGERDRDRENGDDGNDEEKKWKGHGHRSVRIKPNPDPKAVDSNAERLQDPGMTLHMMQAVEVVNRNFWTFVADEMERATGEFFDWGALERRFGEL